MAPKRPATSTATAWNGSSKKKQGNLFAGAPPMPHHAELRDTIEREENITSGDAKDYFDANRNIHRKFVELAGNRFLLDMFDMIWGKAMAFHLFAAIEKIDLSKSLGDHTQLVDVLETGDRGAALEAFTAHIQDGFDLQMEALATDP